jgi:hypothetical protein
MYEMYPDAWPVVTTASRQAAGKSPAAALRKEHSVVPTVSWPRPEARTYELTRCAGRRTAPAREQQRL